MEKKYYPTKIHEMLDVGLCETFTIITPSGKELDFWLNVDFGDREMPKLASDDLKHCDPFWIVYALVHPDRMVKKRKIMRETLVRLKALYDLGANWLVTNGEGRGRVVATSVKPFKNGKSWVIGEHMQSQQVEYTQGQHDILNYLVSPEDKGPLDIKQVLSDNGIEVD